MRVRILWTISLLLLSLTPAFAKTDPEGPANRVDQRRAQRGALPTQASPSGFYLVLLADPPLATYDGSLPGLEATSPRLRGERKLQARSPAALAYSAFLEGKQTQFLAEAGQLLGRPMQPLFTYRAVANGVAIRLEHVELERVAALPGVRRILPDRIVPQNTDRGPWWIGADGIWDGSATGGPTAHGEGVIVGVIDSGVNMNHASFAEVGGDGYSHINPNGAGVFLGWCDPSHPNYSPSYNCNDKLIGAWDYTDAYCAANPTVCTETDGPEDNNGHGSHTASTAAGNTLLSPAISGVSPHSNLITYDACYVSSTGQGLCPSISTAAGVEQAVLDGVGATNYSIGGGDDPWGGDIDTFFLEAFGAGVYPAASAGNDGANTVGHLGPWMSTTGASTHDRESVGNELTSMSGGVSPPSDISGASRTDGYGPGPIVYAGDFSNGDPNPEQCLNPFPAGTWTGGEIVLCDRGDLARVLKCAHVEAGGAAGCVLANANATQTAPVADAHLIPSIHVDLADGDTLRAWLAAGGGHTATITATTITTNPALADIMGSFSSTGPNESFSVMKPDLAAPGVQIFAAWADDPTLPVDSYATIDGTSMASPHNAGSGALMASLQPTWSPAQIKSAIMLTADTTVKKSNGTTDAELSDMGAGRIDLSLAAQAGLLLDESYENMLAADPLQGGRPEELNLASLQENSCVLECGWTRTFESTRPGVVNWTITASTPDLTFSPTGFTLATGVLQPVDFDLDVSTIPLASWRFEQVTLTPDDGSPTLHLPVAAKRDTAKIPDYIRFESTDRQGAGTIEGLQYATAISDLTLDDFGLVLGSEQSFDLNQDPTNGDPYDNLGQVFWTTVSVPAGARRLAALTRSSQSPDVDLFVGTGGTPSAATEVCVSATATAAERCDIFDPVAGTWWILVQNWQGSASQPDTVYLTQGVVGATSVGNVTITGPGSGTVAAGDPFDLDVDWDLSSLQSGDIWLGVVDVGSSAGSPGDVGTINFDVLPPESFIFADGFESGDVTSWSNHTP